MTNSNGNGRTLTAIRPDIFQIFLQDEDGQNILSIDDGTLRQSLRIEIVNTSGRNIEFQSIGNQISLENYHFCISFRPGTLLLTQDEDKRITLKETDEGWRMQQQDNVFYLLLTSSERKVIENGERITLTLENIGAAPEGGSRGTRVEIKYNYLQYQGSNETISGNRLQYLNIVNQRGKKQIPLYVGFLGSNTILNDGTENELTLTIQSLPNQNSSLTLLESPEIAIIDTTRWQGDLVKFIQEKIPNFQSEIEKIAQNPNISDTTKQFFVLLKESVNSNDSFEDFQTKLTDLTLDASDKETIFKILLSNLGVIIEEDLNAILTQLKSLLYPEGITQQEQERIKGIILQIIQESENFKVIRSELNSNSFLGFKGLDGQSILDQAAKFTISFDVTTTDDNGSKNWALVDKTDADDIQIEIVRGQENWIFGGKEEQGITPRWNFICKQGLQLQDRTEILRFSISKLKTQLLSGYANLYVHYENIPGYWDGYISVPIHKGPLVYREKISNNVKVGCVGIGTDKPQAKLHVKSANGVDGLKVDGNTAIAGQLSVTKAIQPSAGNSENEGIMFPKDPFGGSSDKAWIRYYRRGNSGENTVFEIGTANDAGDHIALMPNKGGVGIGTTNPAERLQIADFSAQSDNYLKIGTAGRNQFRGGIKFRAHNDEHGFTIENDDRRGNYGLNILRHDNDTTGRSALFINKRNGNVGVGTNNPGSNKLKVDGNTAIAGNLSVTGRQTTLEQESWQPINLLNGWKKAKLFNDPLTPVPLTPPGYFKDSFGIVHLRGAVQNGNNQIFKLPVGYRPEGTVMPGPLMIHADGRVISPFGHNGWVNLYGITFMAQR